MRGLKVTFVHNPDFAEGLASSVKAGIAAVPADADGAVICLGDMPLIDAHLIDRLIEAFAPDRGGLIAVPVSDGRRGNPVLWSRRFFNELMTLDGDIGARHLIAKHGEAVAEVPVEGHGAFPGISMAPQALEGRKAGAVVRFSSEFVGWAKFNGRANAPRWGGRALHHKAAARLVGTA